MRVQPEQPDAGRRPPLARDGEEPRRAARRTSRPRDPSRSTHAWRPPRRVSPAAGSGCDTPATRASGGEPVELLVVVDDHERRAVRRTANASSSSDLVLPCRTTRDAGRARRAGTPRASPAGRREQIEPLLQRDPDHGGAREGLHRVSARGRSRPRRRDIRSRRSSSSKTRSGRAEARREIGGRDPATRGPRAEDRVERPGDARRRAPRPAAAQPSTRSIDSGARHRPAARAGSRSPACVRAQSHSRACVSALVVVDHAALRVEAMERARPGPARACVSRWGARCSAAAATTAGTSASARSSVELGVLRAARRGPRRRSAAASTPRSAAFRRMLAMRACPYCT